MTTFVTLLHVFVAVLLIVLVLIQDSKSDGALGIGGSSKSLLGATGAQTLAAKLTAGAAVVFAVTSLTLTSLTSGGGKSVVDSLPAAAVAPNTSAPIDATAGTGTPAAAPVETEAAPK